MFGDGLSLYGYVGQNALRSSDPTGLLIATSWVDALERGALVADLARRVSETMGMLQEMGVEWALDWTRADDEITSIGLMGRYAGQAIEGEAEALADGWMPGSIDQIVAKGAKRGHPDRKSVPRRSRHGSQEHWDGIREEMRELIRDEGISQRDVRVNQAIYDPHTKRKLSNARPDVCAITSDKRIYIREVATTQDPRDAERKMQRLKKQINKNFPEYTVHIKSPRRTR